MKLNRYAVAAASLGVSLVAWQVVYGERERRVEVERIHGAMFLETRGPFPTTEDEFDVGDLDRIRVRLSAADGEEFLTAVDDCGSTAACTAREPGFSVLDPRPTPLTVQWDAKELDALDPQIAASSTHVIVTTSSWMAFYEKNGTLLARRRASSGLSVQLKNPIDAVSFFKSLIPAMNASLNLQPEAAERLKSDGSLFYGIDEIYDLRVTFDRYRKRFWIVGLARNANADSEFLAQNVYRRTKFVLAVSRTQNPMDGFSRYFFEAQPDDGKCWDPCGCSGVENYPGAAADYPSIGITDELVLLTVTGGQHPKLAASCLTDEQKARYAVVIGLDADDLANGLPADGFRFYRLPTPDDDPAAPARAIRPATHHTPTPWKSNAAQPAAFFVNFHGAETFVIWGVHFEPDQGPPYIVRVPVTPIHTLRVPGPAPQRSSPPEITEPRPWNPGFGRFVMNAVYRDGRIYVTGSDCRSWSGATECVAAIRLFRVNVSQFPTPPPTGPSDRIDRTFGERNVYTDPADAIVYYGWPWIEVNSEGTMVLSYNRTGNTVFPEARFSVRTPDEPDLQPSYVLHKGTYTLGKQMEPDDPSAGKIDNSGMSLDGFDPTAVWMVQPYAYRPDPNVARGSYRLAVGKVFGRVHPDLVIKDVRVVTPAQGQGDAARFEVNVRNQGDGPSDSAELTLLLSADRVVGVEVPLMTVAVPPIPPGREVVVAVQARADAPPGRYWVRARIARVEPGPEYSSENNTSRITESDRLIIVGRASANVPSRRDAR
jgi:hypothetical protein